MLERTDALTKKPLNFYKEEKTRKKETDRWLERHFGGSEWSLLTGTSMPTTTATTNGDATVRSRYLSSMRPEINTTRFVLFVFSMIRVKFRSYHILETLEPTECASFQVPITFYGKTLSLKRT